MTPIDIKDVTGLEKPLTKLVETISVGVGIVGNAVFKFDAKKIERVSAAEAEAKKQEIIKIAEGESEVQAILMRAGNRFALEQYDKQVNLENIIARTSKELEGQEVSDDPVDVDWTTRFLQIAQDISKEEMQVLLSEILAGEVKKPGAFSLETLDFVRNLSQDVLVTFQKICSLTALGGRVYVCKRNANDGFFDFSYSDLMLLQEKGLIQPTLAMVGKFGNLKKDQVISIPTECKVLIFKSEKDQQQVDLPIIQLTQVGMEIAPLISDNSDKDRVTKYFEQLVLYLEDQKELSKIKELKYKKKQEVV